MLRHLYSAFRFLSFSLLQLWDTVRWQLAFEHTCPRPLNCVTFHPEGQVIAIGSWAGSFSFFHVDGLKAIKVRWSCVALGEEAQEGGSRRCGVTDIHVLFHFGLVLRAGPDISISTPSCRNWEPQEPPSVP